MRQFSGHGSQRVRFASETSSNGADINLGIEEENLALMGLLGGGDHLYSKQ